MKSNTLSWLNTKDKKKIKEIIRKNKVILAPSDTVLGLCGAMHKEVLYELNKLKGRENKPFLVLARSLDDVRLIAQIPPVFENNHVLKGFWPGPLTVIFNVRPEASVLAGCLLEGQKTIAVRIPRSEFLQELLAVQPFLFSTSANKAGESIPNSLNEVDELISQKVAAIVSFGNEASFASTIPSTIIDVTGNAAFCVREGAISCAELEM